MVPASREDISSYFDAGIKDGFTHMLMVCDEWDFSDFPVYANGGTEARERFGEYEGKSGYHVIEIYDLRLSKDPQMREYRAFHLDE